MNSTAIRKHVFSSNSVILLIAFLTWMSACYLNLKNRRPEIVLSKQDTALNINTNLLVVLSAGHKRLITDLLWIQTLLESDTEQYKKRDLNNWLFLRFNTISTLDPLFYQNYLYGGQFLSIIKDDLEGAKIIFDKGLSKFPDDYQLNFHNGFMHYFEMGDFENGLKYLSTIESNPRAPIFLKSITNKLRFHIDGKLDKAFELVLLNYQATENEMLRERLRKDLYSIRAQLDLECLNGKGSYCNIRDFDGNPYQLLKGVYKTVKPFTPFRIRTRNKNKN